MTRVHQQLTVRLRKWGSAFFFCLACLLPLIGQKAMLVESSEDTSKVSLLSEIGREIQITNPTKAREYFQTAVNLARELGYAEGMGRTYTYWGDLEDKQQQYATAITLFQKGIAAYKLTRTELPIADLYIRTAQVQQKLQDEISALDNFHRALLIYEDKESWQNIARVQHQICWLHFNLGNYPEALNHIHEVLDIAERFSDENRIANAQMTIGRIKNELDQHEEALKSYEKAMQRILPTNDSIKLSELHRYIGDALDDLSELKDDQDETEIALQTSKEALEHFKQALFLLRGTNDSLNMSKCYIEMGIAQKNIGSFYEDIDLQSLAESNWQTALSYFNKALTLNQSTLSRLEAYNGLGDVYRRQGNYDLALDYAQQYLNLALAEGSQKFIQRGYKDLSRAHAAMDNYEEAFEFRKKYDEVRYAYLDEQRIKDFERREVLYGDRQKQYEIERQQKELLMQEAELRQARTRQNSLIAGSLFLLILALLMYYAYRMKNQATADLAIKNHLIEAERQRAEDLLLNILPEETARELQTYGQAKAKRYNSVTVMFIDFKSFTQITEQLSPEELVHELDVCFKAFDEITTRFNIEKIKTVGDSYVCAGGMPTPNTTHPSDAVRAALVIQQWMTEYKEERQAANRPYFEARIGIHTGAVVAGIVGSKKFAYDIWGDTVNMTARIEAAGEVGRVNISETTYALVKEQFNCISRGKIQAKHKGEVDMYFVESGKPVLMENRA